MKAILLNSGGADTLAAIMKLKDQHGEMLELHSIYINIGQENHLRASKAAKLLALHYCSSHEEIVFPGNWTMPIDQGDLLLKPRNKTPLIGFICHVMGAMKARQLNLGYITGGFDTGAVTEQFCDKFVELQEQFKMTQYTITPIHPVIGMSVTERLEYIKDNPLANKTVSCHLEVACGRCPKCFPRINLGIAIN